MTSKEIFFLCIAVSVGILMLSFAKNKTTCFAKVFFRGVMSIFAIYFVNAIFDFMQIPLNLGVNYYTVCTSTILGIPGLALLYGISGCKLL